MITVTDKNVWDDLQDNAMQYNIYQTFQWGEFKKIEGWDARRFLFKIDDTDFTIAQVLEKTIFNNKIIWIPGGPISSKQSSFKSYDCFLQDIVKYYSDYKFVLRINQQYPTHSDINFLLEKNGFTRPIKKRTSEYTIYINTGNFKEKTTKNWYRNYKRSQKYHFDFLVSYDDSLYVDILKLYNETVSLKKLKNIPDFSHISSIPLSGRIILKYKKIAFDYIAGTSYEGRKMYSSYFLMYSILCWLQEMGVELFDFSGISPVNEGVFNFKKGSGGHMIQFIGEWEYSNSFFLKQMLNAYLFIQQNSIIG